MEKNGSFTPTDEQQAAINTKARVCLVRAYAGSGKTAMLSAYARRRPEKSMLYLAFNKSIQTEAEGKFPPNVRCVTSHAVAYKAIIVDTMRLSREQAGLKLGDSRIMEIASVFNRNAAMCRPFVETVKNFMVSASPTIGVTHIPPEVVEKFNGSATAMNAILSDAKALWGMMCDPKNLSVRLPHDGYLKLFQLSNPKLPYDTILFDEAQDSNPVTTAIVMAQDCEKMIVGDSHQGIYQFRGSRDALDIFKHDECLHLTKSFRFGKGVANFASILLHELGGATHPVIGLGKHPNTLFKVDRSKTYAVLSRTNAMLFDEAVSAMHLGQKLAFVGGIRGYKVDAIQDAYNLFINDRVFTDNYFNRFDSFAHFEQMGEEMDDPEIKVLCKIVNKYGNEIPELLEQLKREAMTYDARATVKPDVILSTAHKSKGLEFDQVVLTDDYASFFDEEDNPLEPGKIKPEDVNLLYVAATRAERALHLPITAKEWLAHIGVGVNELNHIDVRDWYGPQSATPSNRQQAAG